MKKRIPKVGEYYEILLVKNYRSVQITRVDLEGPYGGTVFFKYLDCKGLYESDRSLDHFYESNNPRLLKIYSTPLWKLLND